jgi:hypothetical protein
LSAESQLIPLPLTPHRHCFIGRLLIIIHISIIAAQSVCNFASTLAAVTSSAALLQFQLGQFLSMFRLSRFSSEKELICQGLKGRIKWPA